MQLTAAGTKTLTLGNNSGTSSVYGLLGVGAKGDTGATGAKGDKGDTGAPGGSDAAFAGWINDTTPSATRAALNASYEGAGVSLRSFGLTDSSTDIKPALTAAVAAGAKHIIIPWRITPWPLLSTFTGTGLFIRFAPGAQIDARMTSGAAFELTDSTVYDYSSTSPYVRPLTSADYGTYGMFARSLRIHGRGGLLGRTYIENACHGVDMRDDAKNVFIQNLEAKNIHQRTGWGAALHVAGCSDIVVGHIKATSVDRFIEVEAGSTDVHVQTYYGEDIFPVTYTGQPTDSSGPDGAPFATYTWGLSAHSHSGEGACINIRYGKGVLKNAANAVAFVRSNGTDDNDMPRDCSVESVHVIGNAPLPGAYEMFALQGHNCGVDDILIRLGAGITSLMKVRFYAGPSDDCYIGRLRAEAFTLPLVLVDNQHVGAKVTKVRPVAGGVLAGSSGYIIDAQGANTRVEHCDIVKVTGSLGYVRTTSSAVESKIKDNHFELDTSETFAATVVTAAAQSQVDDNTFINRATTPPVDVQMTNTSTTTTVMGNQFDRASTDAGIVVDLIGGSSNNLVTGNTIGSTLATIRDKGSNNYIKGNRRGSKYDDGQGSIRPKNHSMYAWSFDPAMIQGTTSPALGTIHVVRLDSPQASTIRNIDLYAASGLVGGVSGQCWVGVYDSTGTLLDKVDVTATFASSGSKSCALTANLDVPVGDLLVAFLFNGTTAPAMGRGGTTSATNHKITATPRFATANTGVTDLPTTLGTLTAVNNAWFAGVSP